MTTTADATILLQWFSIKDQAIVGGIQIYGPPGAAASPEVAAAPVTDPTAATVTAPVTAPAFEPVQAPEALTALAISRAYAPVIAPVYGSTFLQVRSKFASCFCEKSTILQSV